MNMKINNPLVSIIIPTYNRWKYIEKAINSCLNQSYKNIEILVIDDCSDDNTKEVVTSIWSNRVKYFINDKNSWAPYSRNRWIKLSKWDFINFLDDDDELLVNKIELQLNKFNESDIDNLWVVTCDIEYRRSDNKGVKENRKKWFIYRDLLKWYCVYWTLSMLIKKEVFNKVLFDEKLQSWQEYDLMIQISKIWWYDYVDTILVLVNESENQISFNFRKKIDWTRYLFKKYNKEFKNKWYKFYLYNILRFKYLIFKYYIWLILWKKIYLILP